MAVASLFNAKAQDRTLGTSWSLSEVGVTYEHYTSEDGFARISLQAEMFEIYFGNGRYPGVSADFTWNMRFAQIKSGNHVPISFLAGPGFAVGQAKDLGRSEGFFFGLVGRVGLQCAYERGVNMSISLAPILGLHVSKSKENYMMRVYNNGLLQAVMPEISLSYRF